MERRMLGYTAAVVGVFALIVVGALALGGDEEEPQEAASDAATKTGGGGTGPAGTAADEVETETGGEGTEATESAPEREAEREPGAAPQPARYTPYSASTGDWQAQLPSGNGWGAPRETQLAGDRGLRIAVRGPAGAALVIDYTPSQLPRFGSKYRSRRELPQVSVGSMTEYRLSADAVGYVLNTGEGGFRIFATRVEGPVARRVADSLTYVDL